MSRPLFRALVFELRWDFSDMADVPLSDELPDVCLNWSTRVVSVLPRPVNLISVLVGFVLLTFGLMKTFK